MRTRLTTFAKALVVDGHFKYGFFGGAAGGGVDCGRPSGVDSGIPPLVASPGAYCRFGSEWTDARPLVQLEKHHWDEMQVKWKGDAILVFFAIRSLQWHGAESFGACANVRRVWKPRRTETHSGSAFTQAQNLF
jgi:hypothetical protein